VTPDTNAAAFTHQATPEVLLAAARSLFGRAPEAVLFSVPVESTAFGHRLTPVIQEALDSLVAEIVDIIARES
jgi:Ni,Fe-hydrogenase maturation factor